MIQPSLSKIQGHLCVLYFDSYVADAFTSGLVDTLEPRSRWQAAVDTLYRLAVCGLIWSPSVEGADKLLSYIDELSRVDPFPENEFPIEWNQVDLFGSELNKQLMERFGMTTGDGSPNHLLNDVLRKMFADHGVPMETYPIKWVEF